MIIFQLFYLPTLAERIAELKIQEYMCQKLEREKRLALERRLAKEEKEKEYDRILLRQEKLMESKTERNELEYRRQREEVERVFRRREKEAAIKKREIADGIAKARNVQLEEVVSAFLNYISDIIYRFIALTSSIHSSETSTSYADCARRSKFQGVHGQAENRKGEGGTEEEASS